MNSPTRVPLPVVVACAGLTAGLLVMPWMTASVYAQATGGGAATAPGTAPAINSNIPPIPAAMKAAAPGPAQVTQINQYITAHIGNILSGDPLAMKASRDALVNGSYNAGQPAAVQAYQVAYATALNTAVPAALGQTKDVRAQLNLAVVVARVAEQTQATQLDGAVLALLGQQQTVAIKLWGLKAARPIVPALANINRAQPVITQILAVAQQHANDGAIASEAYEALAPETTTKLSPNVIGQLVTPLLALNKQRIAEYQKGLPNEPGSDAKPFSFLSKEGVWDKALTPAQQAQTMQQLCELLTLSAARFDQVQDRATREQLQPMINTSIQALAVMALITNASAPTSNAGQLATAANDALRVASSANAVMVQVVAPLCPAISQVKGFEKVAAPPAPGPMPVGPASKPAGPQGPAGPAGPAVGPGGGAGAAGAGAGAGAN